MLAQKEGDRAITICPEGTDTGKTGKDALVGMPIAVLSTDTDDRQSRGDGSEEPCARRCLAPMVGDLQDIDIQRDHHPLQERVLRLTLDIAREQRGEGAASVDPKHHRTVIRVRPAEPQRPTIWCQNGQDMIASSDSLSRPRETDGDDPPDEVFDHRPEQVRRRRDLRKDDETNTLTFQKRKEASNVVALRMCEHNDLEYPIPHRPNLTKTTENRRIGTGINEDVDISGTQEDCISLTDSKNVERRHVP